jgi:hypothetical protein
MSLKSPHNCQNSADEVLGGDNFQETAAELVLAHDSERSTMQDAKLLVQHHVGDQQRLGDRSQIPMVRDKLSDPHLALGPS